MNARFKATKYGIVMYLAGEGRKGIRKRLKALAIRHGKTAEDLKLFHISRNTISLDGAGAKAVIREVKRLEELYNVPVALIVVDTLARHLLGDENSSKDMGVFVQAVDSVRAAFPGSVALIVHHTGYGEDTKGRGRGSSALKGAMDFEILCDKGLLTFTKMKDGEQPEPIEFKLCPVQIDTDEHDEPITSCFVEYGERSAKNRESSLTVNERLLSGLVPHHPDNLELRIAFYDKRKESEPEVKANTLKNAFLRAYQGLLDKKIIKDLDGKIELANPATVTRHTPSQNVTNDEGDRASHVTLSYKECDDVTAPEKLSGKCDWMDK